MKSPARIRLRLLGRFVIASDETGAKPLRLSARKCCALIAYLAMSPEQAASREELATLLWGGCSDQQARQSLRQALALLRKELGSPHYFVAGPTMIQLEPGIWSTDALEFERLSRSTNADECKLAANLFGGEFLTGLNLDEEGFDEWLRSQRQRNQTAIARLCETFVERPDLVVDWEDALTAMEKLQALDPLREDWHRWALTLYARYRGKHEAMAQAEAFATLLKRELGVAPEPETQALVERIRDGSITVKTAPAGTMVVAASTTSALPGAASHEMIAGVPIDSGAPSATPASSRRQWSARAAGALMLAALALAVIGFGLNRVRPFAPRDDAAPKEQPAQVSVAADPWLPPQPAPRSDTDHRRSRFIIPIAVLPFKTYGETEGATQLIANMMMDDLINVLSRVPQIRVISRQTAHSYEGKSIDIAAIGAELQVRYVLEGSMRIQNGKLRVNFELVDPSTQLPVYSGRIDRDGADRQAVQDEIVGRLARELQVEIFPLESARHAGDKNADVLSYRGWSALHAAIAHIDLEQYNAAKALFEQALALEPGHIAAKLGLGVYHSNLGVQRLDPQTADHLEKGLSILREIVSRDPTNGVAYYHLGVALQGTTKLAEGLDALEQAIRLNPSNAGAHAHVGHVLARLARPDEGIQHIHYAMRLSPKDPAMSIWLEFAGAAELEREHYAEAIENFRHSAELSPNYPRPWAGLAAAYALEGKLDEAQRPMGRLKALSPNLSADELFIRFGRRGAPRLKDGLRLALASS